VRLSILSTAKKTNTTQHLVLNLSSPQTPSSPYSTTPMNASPYTGPFPSTVSKSSKS
jgi:hypothetical protein